MKKPPFANLELEERLLYGKNPWHAIAAGDLGHAGSTCQPRNNADTMLRSFDSKEVVVDEQDVFLKAISLLD